MEQKLAEVMDILYSCYLGKLPKGFTLYDARELEQAYNSLFRERSAVVVTDNVKNLLKKIGFNVQILKSGWFLIS